MPAPHEQSAIEKATLDVVYDVNSAITLHHKLNHVPVPEKEFRRIIAGYFERQTIREWQELLGITADPQ